MGRGVILVRHALPAAAPGFAPSTWLLGEHALEDCVLLAHQLPPGLSPRVVASPERKCEQTAQVVALRRGLFAETDPRLREVDRPEDWDDAYRDRAAAYLAAGGASGWEHSRQVAERIGACVDEVLAAEPDGDLLVVTGGLALTLFAASRWPIGDVVRFWSGLAYPDAYRLDLETHAFTRLFFGGNSDADWRPDGATRT